MTFSGYRLRRFRLKLEMSQEQLAQALGVSRNTISAYECGRAKPTVEHFYELTKFFEAKIPTFTEHQLFSKEGF